LQKSKWQVDFFKVDWSDLDKLSCIQTWELALYGGKGICVFGILLNFSTLEVDKQTHCAAKSAVVILLPAQPQCANVHGNST